MIIRCTCLSNMTWVMRGYWILSWHLLCQIKSVLCRYWIWLLGSATLNVFVPHICVRGCSILLINPASNQFGYKSLFNLLFSKADLVNKWSVFGILGNILEHREHLCFHFECRVLFFDDVFVLWWWYISVAQIFQGRQSQYNLHTKVNNSEAHCWVAVHIEYIPPSTDWPHSYYDRSSSIMSIAHPPSQLVDKALLTAGQYKVRS